MDKKQWLETATFYQIYPQSFFDSNGDGIGDLDGITAKISYLKRLGIKGIWLNPIFDSPFKDAGYDVRDYYTVASRYGTTQSLETLVEACHGAGIKILLDLVPGHTSDQNPWFEKSCEVTSNEFSDRYIWTDSWFGNADGLPFVAGVAPRNGCYVLNFFHSQPALNYGFGKSRESWQSPTNAPGPRANRQEMSDIIRFWLAKGVDGFRVDMADSLVKHDEGKQETIKAWQEIFSLVKPDYPEAIFVSEWGRPQESLAAGFDMDFYLDWFDNGYNRLVRAENPFFSATSTRPAKDFIEQYLPQYLDTKPYPGGHFTLISGNHDCTRLAHHLNDTERRLFFLFLLTMPGVPFIYYGDEIGMTWRDLPTHEGGYTRTGSRTPMQWSNGPQSGFSNCSTTYLPVFADTSVKAQENDDTSLLSFVCALIQLRSNTPALHASAGLEFLNHGTPARVMHYRREDVEIIINMSTEPYSVPRQNKDILFATEQPVRTDLELVIAPVSGVVLSTQGT